MFLVLVVLLHGLRGASSFMKPLAQQVERRAMHHGTGVRTLSLDYPSRNRSLGLVCVDLLNSIHAKTHRQAGDLQELISSGRELDHTRALRIGMVTVQAGQP